MSKILLVVEGKHEWTGAAQAWVSRLLGGNHEFVADRLANSPARVHGKGRGYEKKAIRWLIEAQKRDYDALVLLVDRDGNENREREITTAQRYGLADGQNGLPRAMGVAVEMFDAWMLADEQALTRVLGVTIQTQPEPENLRNPKKRFTDLVPDSFGQTPVADLYKRIAEEADIERVKARCPGGFQVFADRLQQMRL